MADRSERTSEPGVGRVLPRWAVAAVAVLVAVLTAAAVLSLFWWLGGLPLAGRDRATAQLDALKVGLSVGVGAGGVFALYLAARRQRSTELQVWQQERDLSQRDAAQRHVEQVAAANEEHQKRVAAATEADALERRVTELYATAADQLGSDRAPVRMAGLYALERLAQANPDHRQTMVNVLCAYLRMPYDVDNIGREEREVRRTALKILTAHLQPSLGVENTPDDPRFLFRQDPAKATANPKFWPDIDVDLSGAVLVADFPGCRFRDANFNGTRFTGGLTYFSRSEFDGLAKFVRAEFDMAAFDSTRFHGAAIFQNTKFAAKGDFSYAEFHSISDLTFEGPMPHVRGLLIWTEPDDPTFNCLLPYGWAIGDPVDTDTPPPSPTGQWCHIVDIGDDPVQNALRR